MRTKGIVIMQQDLQQDSQESQQLKHLILRSEENTNNLPQILIFGDLHVNTVTHEVKRAGRQIELTTTEYQLLELFMRHPRQILDRQTILHQVWSYDFQGETNIIE